MERRSIPPEQVAAAADVSHSTLDPPLACVPAAAAASDSIVSSISSVKHREGESESGHCKYTRELHFTNTPPPSTVAPPVPVCRQV